MPENSASPNTTRVSKPEETTATQTAATEPVPSVLQPTAPEAKPEQSVADDTSVDDHVEKGISLLQNGEIIKAKTELYAALRKDPGNIAAVNLVHQINTDAAVYFAGETHFFYEIQSADTLSTVASKFLNDPLKFYILAKYNDIEIPAAVKMGKTIKIPGEKNNQQTPAPVPSRKEIPESSESDLQFTLAKKYYDSGKFQIAIDILEKYPNEFSKDTPFRDLLVLSYTKYADVLAEKADLLEAQTVLEKALSMQPRNSRLQKQLEALSIRREADHQYQNGVEALQAGIQNKAYEYFRKSLELQPEHPLARKQIFRMKSELVDTYHKKAMQLYSKQQLLEAVKYWDRVLELDPNHEMARLYRARALELQERLNNF